MKIATADEVNNLNAAQAANHLALIIVLTEKGILTEDDDDIFEAARMKAIHLVEQEMAKKRDAKK